MKLLPLQRNAAVKQMVYAELLLFVLSAVGGALCSLCFPPEKLSAAISFSPCHAAVGFFLLLLLILLSGVSLIGSPAVLCLDFVFGYLTAVLCRCCYLNSTVFSFKWVFGFLFTLICSAAILAASHYSCRMSLDILRRLKGDTSLRSRIVGYAAISLFSLFATTAVLAIALPKLGL